MTGALYYGDNLTVLREQIADESVDLIYLDPPFNSQANYNVLFRSPTGQQSQAQIEAFEDTWRWNDAAEFSFNEILRSGNASVSEMMRAMRAYLDESDLMAYLAMMAIRLIELRRILRPTGAIYLHCDPTASHYLKLLLDVVFGAQNYLNEVVWKRTGTHSSARRWGPVHDTILAYARQAGEHVWNRPYLPHSTKHLANHYRKRDAAGRLYEHGELTAPGTRNGRSGAAWRGFDVTSLGRHWITTVDRLEELYAAGRIYIPDDGGWPRLIRYADESKGRAVGDVWEDIPPLNMRAKERLGYPTQKPVALLERIIDASSNEDGVVLDPFCGCGTAVHAAQKLGRNWIGIDITHLAISLIKQRLEDAFPGVEYEVHGTPRDLDGARALAGDDKYQFQWWAGSLVNAVPYGGKKRGADSGIDGIVYFKPDARTTEKAIVSVKGGATVNVGMIRDLGHVVERERAKVGIFITLAEPTAPMRTEAIKAGFYETEFGQFPKLQILTVEELLSGKRPQLPWLEQRSFRRAKREALEGRQGKLAFG